MSKKKRYTIYLEKEIINQLKIISDLSKKPISQIVEQAISKELYNEKKAVFNDFKKYFSRVYGTMFDSGDEKKIKEIFIQKIKNDYGFDEKQIRIWFDSIIGINKSNIPPFFTKKENFTMEKFGIKIKDPFHWLEDSDSEETKSWTSYQNKLTKEYLDSVPNREQNHKRIKELSDYLKYLLFEFKNNRLFYSMNKGLQEQAIIYMKEGKDGDSIKILDPIELDKDGNASIPFATFSNDGKKMGYAVSYQGSDWMEIRIRNLDTGKDYDEVIKWCKYTGIAWNNDSTGFYYSRSPEPGSVKQGDETNYQKVYFHKVGTSVNEDILIYKDDSNKELYYAIYTLENDNYIYLTVHYGTETSNRLYYKNTNSKGDFVKLLNDNDANYELIKRIDNYLYLTTTKDAPNGRIIAVDLNNPERKNWKQIVSEQKDVIKYALYINGHIFINYVHNAYNKIKIYNVDGAYIKEIKLPTIGSVAYFMKGYDNDILIEFTSFFHPSYILRFDFETEKLSFYFKSENTINPEDFETKQINYTSKDGTIIPMFISHKKGLVLSGNNQTLLTGYGNFGVSYTPHYSPLFIQFMDKGGVLAIPTIRGGGEFGDKWHKAGIKDKKQNSFDDFISAAEWLIKNNYTNSEKLIALGSSAGGLLVSACIIQKPKLFKAIVIKRAILDMLKFPELDLVGDWAISEYGNPNIKEDFEVLLSYSPLHNVKNDECYPNMLICAAEKDMRCNVAHSKKFFATLKDAQTCDNVILLRVEENAGHHGYSTTQEINEQSDIFTFIESVLAYNSF